MDVMFFSKLAWILGWRLGSMDCLEESVYECWDISAGSNARTFKGIARDSVASSMIPLLFRERSVVCFDFDLLRF
jgi:hypothetical protein